MASLLRRSRRIPSRHSEVPRAAERATVAGGGLTPSSGAAMITPLG
jgi:hypothetical protein